MPKTNGIPWKGDWLVMDDLAVEMELGRQVKDLRTLIDIVAADGRVTVKEFANLHVALDQADESSEVSKAYNRRFLARDFRQLGHAQMREEVRSEKARRGPGPF